jgi:hypothetical protein
MPRKTDAPVTTYTVIGTTLVHGTPDNEVLTVPHGGTIDLTDAEAVPIMGYLTLEPILPAPAPSGPRPADFDNPENLSVDEGDNNP